MIDDPEEQALEDARRDQQILRWKQQARNAAKRRQGRKLYVITLDPQVLERREFRQANPGYVEGMPCLYVGITIHEPGERFLQHKTGYRSSKYPRHYGVELALELIEGFAAGGLSDAGKEAALADWLRDQGCAVWQH
ncbi:MAG: hypothetical protein WBN57_12875 [Gammaproteobacteria bacterium]